MAVKVINTGGAVKLTVPNTDTLKEEIKELQGEVAELQEDVKEAYNEGHNEGYNEGYDKGHVEGYSTGYTDGYAIGESNGREEGREYGFEEGKKAEHNEFWDNYLCATSMNHFFSGSGWNDKNFYPTKDLKPRHAYMMFRDTGITDVWGRMEELGLTLDFSDCVNFYHAFYGYKGTWHGVIDMSNVATGTSSFYNNSNLVEIEKLIVSKNTVFNQIFTGCSELVKMPVEGTIGTKGFDVSPCVKLNRESIKSIIDHLSDETTGLTVTLSATAVNNAFTTEEWEALRATKNKWTVTTI